MDKEKDESVESLKEIQSKYIVQNSQISIFLILLKELQSLWRHWDFSGSKPNYNYCTLFLAT